MAPFHGENEILRTFEDGDFDISVSNLQSNLSNCQSSLAGILVLAWLLGNGTRRANFSLSELSKTNDPQYLETERAICSATSRSPASSNLSIVHVLVRLTDKAAATRSIRCFLAFRPLTYP
ncbi:unnamed protein product [Haemonchus placei]|uniref:Uncharacterized protein n=1 Tax=Haemonchus placei TaxID=6290 RepID=A0A3P7VJ72_HAEPC|nr:unnamed protein product [Haemonchus placei]